MAEYRFSSTCEGRPVHVQIGWERALQRHYLTIEYADHKQPPVYHHATDPAVSRYTDLAYFVKKLIDLGVTVPKAVIRGLTVAPLHDGTTAAAHGWRKVTSRDWTKRSASTAPHAAK